MKLRLGPPVNPTPPPVVKEWEVTRRVGEPLRDDPLDDEELIAALEDEFLRELL